ncbi:hypothetical protein AVEN_182144-1 [Araneus ventricosus]|uniref:Uncharacterized protein n=1 Tax=Araneus ventricosus TaxID=182803 RepID=A0A4Y2GMV8_ARAVE|nr:hypothetical protein AVEN_182144-1 [Araneus ventricosus]
MRFRKDPKLSPFVVSSFVETFVLQTGKLAKHNINNQLLRHVNNNNFVFTITYVKSGFETDLKMELLSFEKAIESCNIKYMNYCEIGNPPITVNLRDFKNLWSEMDSKQNTRVCVLSPCLPTIIVNLES